MMCALILMGTIQLAKDATRLEKTKGVVQG